MDVENGSLIFGGSSFKVKGHEKNHNEGPFSVLHAGAFYETKRYYSIQSV